MYTPQQIAHVGTARTLWRLLDDQTVAPAKFDSVERAKKIFSAGGAEQASQLYKDDGLLFVRGRRDRFVTSFERMPAGWSRWNIWIDLRAMQGPKLEQWLAWFYRLCQELPPFFAYGCSQEEYDAKHRVVTDYPGGGTSITAVGKSNRDFHQYLPGLYWLTVFGNELVQDFGRSKILHLPNVDITELKSGNISVRLSEPVVPNAMDQRLESERKLADILGPRFFFDRYRSDIALTLPPGLLKSLRILGNA
jgi:hypothetical protein